MKIEDALKRANDIASQAEPLYAIVETMAEGLAHLFRDRGMGEEAATLETQLAAIREKRAELRSTLDEFHGKYPEPAAAAETK